jgi:hypothetical protein
MGPVSLVGPVGPEGPVAQVDPRLTRQLGAAGEEGLVHAILIVTEDEPADGLAADLIAEASASSGRSALRVRHLPRANALIVTAPAGRLRDLLKDHRVLVASATTIDIFPW